MKEPWTRRVQLIEWCLFPSYHSLYTEDQDPVGSSKVIRIKVRNEMKLVSYVIVAVK